MLCADRGKRKRGETRPWLRGQENQCNLIVEGKLIEAIALGTDCTCVRGNRQEEREAMARRGLERRIMMMML